MYYLEDRLSCFNKDAPKYLEHFVTLIDTMDQELEQDRAEMVCFVPRHLGPWLADVKVAEVTQMTKASSVRTELTDMSLPGLEDLKAEFSWGCQPGIYTWPVHGAWPNIAGATETDLLMF